MNSRERSLLLLVGLMLVVMLLYYAVSSFGTSVQQRRTRQQAARAELEKQELTVERGRVATKQLNLLRERSLPADRETAQALYQRWLLNEVDEAGIGSPSVRIGDRRVGGTLFSRLSFKVDGEATLDQALDFLHRFYSSDDLHRIQEFSLVPLPNKDSNRLDLSVTIETMIMRGSKRETVGDLASSRMQSASLDDYRQDILKRNIFAPPNVAPSIKPIASQRVYRGEELSVKVQAEDPDQQDELTFSLVGYVPDGAKIDEKTGSVRWRPDKVDEYDLTVQVTDDGTPQLSHEVTFAVNVREAPPKETVADEEADRPKFDEAEHTYLIGAVSTGQQREVWLDIRTSGKRLRLAKGDRVKVGTVDGIIQEIGDKHVSIRTDDGELVVRVGQNLSEGQITKPLQQAAR